MASSGTEHDRDFELSERMTPNIFKAERQTDSYVRRQSTRGGSSTDLEGN